MLDVALATIFCASVSSGLIFWMTSAAGLKFYGWMIVILNATSMILMCTDFHSFGLYTYWFSSLVTGLLYWTIWRKRLVPWINPTPKTEAL